MASATVPTLSTAARLRAILGGSLGNLVEWYDWYAYSAFTLYFAPSFFPAENQTAQLLGAAMIFAVGFLMRPLGAWIMGIYADRHGRKAGLALSVALMGGGSLLIALMPTYRTIGMGAPALLLLARLMQGLSVGGEYGASATYLSEMAGAGRRGFWSSFQYVTLIAGQQVALCVLLLLQAVLGEGALQEWGWRLAFAFGAVLAFSVWGLRRGLAESPDYERVRGEGQGGASSALALVRQYPGPAALVLALTAGGTVAFYAYSIYMQKFLANSAGFSRPQASAIMAGALLAYMVMQPLAGLLSDRIGRRPLLIGFGVLGTVFTVPIFHAIQHAHNVWVAFALVLAALAIVTGYTSINAVVKAELFPARIRALGVALPYALANALFGGTAESVALLFKDRHMESGFFWYVSGMIALSLIAYVFMREPPTLEAAG